MRLIDADALLELYADSKDFSIAMCNVPIPIIRQNILDMPTIDAVPVVHCRDCENHRWYTNRYGVEISTCTLLCVDVCIDDFCSYGERRDTHGN